MNYRLPEELCIEREYHTFEIDRVSIVELYDIMDRFDSSSYGYTVHSSWGNVYVYVDKSGDYTIGELSTYIALTASGKYVGSRQLPDAAASWK